jgi:hypothetical protein
MMKGFIEGMAGSVEETIVGSRPDQIKTKKEGPSDVCLTGPRSADDPLRRDVGAADIRTDICALSEREGRGGRRAEKNVLHGFTLFWARFFLIRGGRCAAASKFWLHSILATFKV